MRVLGVGHHNDLGAMYLRLRDGGHEVRVHVADPDSADVLEGLLERARSLGEGMDWVRAGDGLVLFEGIGWGALQDELRAKGVRVVGGSGLGDRLETDRAYAQSVLADAGLKTAETLELDGFDRAIARVEEVPARYVVKFSGAGYASTRSYVGALDDGKDVLAVLRLQRSKWRLAESPRVVLMRHLRGVEVGVGGFFDGHDFLRPVNLDWEHKRFFPGNLGELTGEMGTVVTYRGGERLFAATLARMGPLLASSAYVGYVNLNLIVNDDGAWPLELTCRFGYPGFAILSELHDEPWDTLLARLAGGGSSPFRTHDGLAVGVVLTVPPFPYPDGYERLSKGTPVTFRHDFDARDGAAVHYGEMRLDEGGELVTAGQIGYVAVVTGRGDTIEAARAAAYARAEKVILPNVRYRNDIGAGFATDRAELVRLGWLDG